MCNKNIITESEKHKELDLIQGCISRMANNSFLLKGWLITLVAVVLAFIPENIDMLLISSILIMIIFCFWYLDAFYLRTEKMYVALYNWVIVEREKNNRHKLYDLNPRRFKGEVKGTFKVMFSKTLIPFYVVPMVVSIAVVAIEIFK